MLETRELHAFIVLAEELNFRMAAERLNMTQPPLTRLIHQLEERLGSKLFSRTTRKVELTGAGVVLLKEAREILAKIEATEAEIKKVSKLKTGTLKISLSSASFHSEAPRLISSFKGQFKGLNVDLVDIPLAKQFESLKNGKVDICFVDSALSQETLCHYEIQKFELGLLVSKEHPLAKRHSLRLEDLNQQTLIFHGKSEASGFQEEFKGYLKKAGIKVNIYYKKPGESCPHLSQLNKGILLTAKSIVHTHLPGVVFIPLSHFTPKLRIFGTWSKTNSSTALKTFLNFLVENHSAPTSHDCHLAHE